MSTALTREASRQLDRAVLGYRGKRFADVLVSAMALALLSPVLVLAALAIRCTSQGPVLFRQKRLGLNEQPFMIFKFRSMRIDAEHTGPQYTTKGDSRITTVGKLLRRTSLDELPQLINVLRGEMSLMGPRPYVGFELSGWTAEQRALRASVRPGISGMAQASGRSSLPPEAACRLDLEYVHECSFWLDCRLVLSTLQSLLGSTGTN